MKYARDIGPLKGLYFHFFYFKDLAGKDSWEQALVDQYMGLVEDMFTELVKVFFEKDEEKKVCRSSY